MSTEQGSLLSFCAWYYGTRGQLSVRVDSSLIDMTATWGDVFTNKKCYCLDYILDSKICLKVD